MTKTNTTTTKKETITSFMDKAIFDHHVIFPCLQKYIAGNMRSFQNKQTAKTSNQINKMVD